MSFDPRALTEPVDPSAVRAFAAQLPHRSSQVLRTLLSITGLIVFALLTLVVFGGIIGDIAAGDSVNPWFVVTLLFPAVGALVGMRNVARRRLSRQGQYRLSRFAAANGMSYLPRIDDPPLPGMIFGMGDSRHSEDVVRGTQPRFVEFGNYQYTVEGEKAPRRRTGVTWPSSSTCHCRTSCWMPSAITAWE